MGNKVDKRNAWVAYVGNIKFPEGSASSQRVFGVAKTIALSGFDVKIGAGSESEGKSVFVNNEYSYGHKNISFEITEDTSESIKSKVAKLKYYLFDGGKKTVNWLNEKKRKPAVVIYYGVNSSFIRRLRVWCSANKIPLVIDVVEWYDPGHLGGYLSILNLENKYALRYLIPKSDGIIVISKYLKKHFSTKNSNVVRIPIIDNSPQNLTHLKLDHSTPIRLMYAGDSGGGKKDLLNIIIEQVAKRKGKFQLDIYGISENGLKELEIFKNFPELRGASNIKAHGRVSRKLVLEALKRAHFIPLLRENKKYAQAGFPTKMVEAMGMGVPLIANVTGDIGDFVIHSTTGWLVEKPSNFGEALDAVDKLNDDEYLLLRENAKTKMKELQPEVFKLSMVEFIDNLEL